MSFSGSDAPTVVLILIAWIYVSEIPTNRLRAYNVALASFTHWVHNLAVSKSTPVMLLHDPWRAYFIFGSFNLFMAIAAYWIPETKGVSHTSLRVLTKTLTRMIHRSHWNAWMRSLVSQTFPMSRTSASQHAAQSESMTKTWKTSKPPTNPNHISEHYARV